MAIRQSGKGRKLIEPLDISRAGINVKLKKTTFLYWTVAGEKKSASGDTSGRIQWDPPLRNIAQSFGGIDDFTVAGAAQRVREEAEIIELEMKENAPWAQPEVSRYKGIARESLYAKMTQSKNKIALVAGYDEDYLMAFQVRDRVNGTWPRNYSVFLETMQNGRFGIVGKTLEGRYGDFMSIFHDMWKEGSPISESFQKRQTRRAEQAFLRARMGSLRG